MEFDIDVSGKDLLSKDFVICVAENDGIVRGYKFSEDVISKICFRFGQGFYRYDKSKRGKTLLKIRIYCVVVYYLVRSMGNLGNVSFNICRDFTGKERDIREMLEFFIGRKLGIDIDKIYFGKLSNDSNAHIFSYLMRHDKNNKIGSYVKIDLEEIERWLK